MVLSASGSTLFETQLSGSVGKTSNAWGGNGVTIADVRDDGHMSVLWSTYAGTLIYTVNGGGVSTCAPWPGTDPMRVLTLSDS